MTIREHAHRLFREREIGAPATRSMPSVLKTCPELETRRGDSKMPPFGVGWWVKVGAFGERFWCHVQQLSGDRLAAVVDNELLHAGPAIQCGDMLSLDERHVLESVGPSEARAFHEMVKALGEDEAAMRWRQSRIDSGVAAPKHASQLVLPSGERRSSQRTRDVTSVRSPPCTGT